MDDLRVPPGPGIPRGLLVPSAALAEQFTHASGPGGQGVNTTDSRVQLSVHLAAIPMTDHQRARLAERFPGMTLTITASEHRSQLRNRAAARERLAETLREALTPEVPRRATRPTRSSQRRRLAAKRARSETKQGRRPPGAE